MLSWCVVGGLQDLSCCCVLQIMFVFPWVRSESPCSKLLAFELSTVWPEEMLLGCITTWVELQETGNRYKSRRRARERFSSSNWCTADKKSGWSKSSKAKAACGKLWTLNRDAWLFVKSKGYRTIWLVGLNHIYEYIYNLFFPKANGNIAVVFCLSTTWNLGTEPAEFAKLFWS